MFEFFIFILVIFLRLYSFYYYFIFRKDLPNYSILGNLCILIPFTRYTDSSLFLSLFWSYNSLSTGNIPELTCTTWCILCNVSLGSWIFKKKLTTHEPNCDTIIYKLTEFLTHGAIPIIMLFDLPNYSFELIHLIYPIIFSFCWLTFIIMPWYYITGDSVYPFLQKDVPLYFKISIMSNIMLINLISGYIGFLICNINSRIGIIN